MLAGYPLSNRFFAGPSLACVPELRARTLRQRSISPPFDALLQRDHGAWPGRLRMVTSSTQACMIARPRPDSGRSATVRSLASRREVVIRLRSVLGEPGAVEAGGVGRRRSLATGRTE